jgi:diguanylate cyclase (GGDEF)-like protein
VVIPLAIILIEFGSIFLLNQRALALRDERENLVEIVNALNRQTVLVHRIVLAPGEQARSQAELETLSSVLDDPKNVPDDIAALLAEHQAKSDEVLEAVVANDGGRGKRITEGWAAIERLGDQLITKINDAKRSESSIQLADQTALIGLGIIMLLATGLWALNFRGFVRERRAMEREMAERRLAGRAEQRMRALLNDASETYVVCSQDTTVEFVSGGVEQLLGVIPSGLVQSQLLSWIEPSAAPLLRALIAEAERTQRPTSPVILETAGADRRIAEVVVTDRRGDSSIGGIVVTLRDVTDRERASYSATHDGITGLPNRAAATAHIDLLVAAAEGPNFAIVALEIDRFSELSGGLGRQATDDLVRELGGRLVGSVRMGDLVFHTGPGTFVVLSRDVDGAGAALEVADRCAALVDEPVRIDEVTHQLVCVAGVALPGDLRIAGDELLANAEVALHSARASKTHRAIYDVGTRRKAAERLLTEAALRRAIEGDELRLHLQPEIDVVTNTVAGFEALVRWELPGQGLIPPNDFIPIAEETGLVIPLGAWVLKESLRQLAEWDSTHAGAAEWFVAVNVSGKQLDDSDFVALVRDSLASSGISPERLVLEVTETAVAEDADRAMAILNELHALGLRIAIDDFGTGYSSLSALREMPVDVLKIDRSFVMAIGVDDRGEAAVTHIVQLAESMGLKTVAEGVETSEQAEHLRALGVDYFQGYFFGRPLPAAEHDPVRLLLTA